MDDFIGAIKLYPFNYIPRGLLLCDGQLVSIAGNNALFALLGTQFGGDGKSTFAVPDLRKASPAPGLRYMIHTVGEFPSRD